MANLTQQLLSQLQGAPMQQMSSQLGLGEQQTSQAVSAALPLLMGALGKNASQPQGAQALLGALQKDHAGGGNLAGLLGSVLGGGGGRQTDGAGILGHILGDNQQRAETGLAQASGLDGNKAGQLMKMLAPLVMAFLANQTRQGSASPQALGALLGQEEQQIRQEGGGAAGLLGAVLDQDGDGKLGLGDVLKIGGSLFGGKR